MISFRFKNVYYFSGCEVSVDIAVKMSWVKPRNFTKLLRVGSATKAKKELSKDI